jgi:C4-dicarboxylate transporter
MTIQMIVGVVVICIAVYFLVKRHESRLVLFLAGLALAIVAGDPMVAFKAFSKAMTNSKLIEPIIASMGFAFVLKVTKCDQHLVNLLAGGLKKVGPTIIPGAVLITAFINISVTSSSGCSAAVGAVLIPLLMRAGVHPAIAAATVFLGTYGSANVNPGYAQVAVIADVAKSTPIEVIANHATPFLLNAVVVAIGLTVVAFWKKEHKGYVIEGVEDQDFEVSWVKSLVPLVPLVLLLLGSTGIVAPLKQLAISHAMIVGSVVAFAVTRVNPAKITKEFFHGAGEGFGHVYGIITCSMVFVGGLTAIGLVDALIEIMDGNTNIAKVSGTVGPFLLAVVTGSGDAAAVAFNTAVTAHAPSFGLDPLNLGSVAAATGGLGRTMSPIAGAAIICAGYAGINPMELAKRNAIPTIMGTVFFAISMLYI